MIGNPYFAGSYWAPGYFGGGSDAPEGSIYASIQGAAVVQATFRAIGEMSATLSGFALLGGSLSTPSEVGELAATIQARASITADLSSVTVAMPKPPERPSGGQFLTYRRHYREPIAANMSARLGGSALVAASASGVAGMASVIRAEGDIKVVVTFKTNFTVQDNNFFLMAA